MTYAKQKIAKDIKKNVMVFCAFGLSFRLLMSSLYFVGSNILVRAPEHCTRC